MGGSGGSARATLQTAFHGDVFQSESSPLPSTSSSETQQSTQEKTKVRPATPKQTRHIWWATISGLRGRLCFKKHMKWFVFELWSSHFFQTKIMPTVDARPVRNMNFMSASVTLAGRWDCLYNILTTYNVQKVNFESQVTHSTESWFGQYSSKQVKAELKLAFSVLNDSMAHSWRQSLVASYWLIDVTCRVTTHH